MTCMYFTFPAYKVNVELSVCGVENHAVEFHLIFHVTGAGDIFQTQLDNLHRAYSDVMNDEVLKSAKPFFKRYFLSDAANQTVLLDSALSTMPRCVTSVVQQSPLDGSKIALWCYLAADMNPEYRHLWTVERTVGPGSSEQQTARLLQQYETRLEQSGCTLANNCVRTWFFVRDVDVNYRGVVTARKENFEQQGLTHLTHYIASTGIEGISASPAEKVMLDTYAIRGLDPGQLNYLYAKAYLSPTYDYGVTFERGVSIGFGDRRQVYISGTASIDEKGNVLHVGDVEQQVMRMWTNVEALLEEAGCSFEDTMQMIVYLRDIGDFQQVKQLFDVRFPGVPKVIVLAPVCRPAWLVEMECIAVRSVDNPEFKNL